MKRRVEREQVLSTSQEDETLSSLRTFSRPCFEASTRGDGSMTRTINNAIAIEAFERSVFEIQSQPRQEV
jgi:hypothetical protein